MLSMNDLLAGMQISFINQREAINTTSDPVRIITYQYAGTSEPGDIPGSGAGFTGYKSLTNAEKQAVRQAMDHMEEHINVEFVEVSGQSDPDLNIAKVQLDETSPGTAGLAGPSISFFGSTDIATWDAFAFYDDDIDLSDPSQQNLILHELGHALGLDHPFEGVILPNEFNSNKYTLMSYTDNPETNDINQTLGLFDIVALQDTWGVAKNKNGNTTYKGPDGDGVHTIHDTGGKDKLAAKNSHGAVEIDLREGKFSSFGTYDDLAIAFGTKIEDANGGSQDDKITGNGLDNKIKGDSGDDTLKGNNGKDTLMGENGDDKIEANGGKDTVEGGGGKDTLDGGGGSDDMSGGEGGDVIEGGSGNDKLIGQKGNDLIKGNSGDDDLRGSSGSDTLLGGSGKDTLDGGTGNDTLTGGNGADKFIFNKGDKKVVITDFENDKDALKIKDKGSKSNVLSKASEENGDVVFDFGSDTLIVENITIAQLTDDLSV